MHMLKHLFQKLKVWPTLTPGDHRQFHLCASGGLQAIQDGIWVIVLQGAMTTAQGENTAVFLTQLTSPWIPNSLPTLRSPYKKGHFKTEFKMVY